MFVDSKISSDPLRRRLRRLSITERIEEAVAFLGLFYSEHKLPDHELARRRQAVVGGLRRHGFYRHTPEELAFGARVAWRNHARCIGRLYWKSLEVYDCRHLVEAGEIAGRMTEHMVRAHNGGRIRSVISIFAPIEGAGTSAWIENRQVAQYAGYARTGGVLGDPLNVEFTRVAMSLGWSPPLVPGPFDLLPLIIRDRSGRRLAYDVPKEAAQQVSIVHPEHGALKSMGLRWHAVPCVSDMILTIGGIDYPCAPFSGWYMGTEIACRDLVDEFRYDLLPQIAPAVGVDVNSSLWKDQALTELNRAVLHSFKEAGVTIVDHHTASAHFVEFMRSERALGRFPSADRSWIVPPAASASCPVYHLPMDDLHDVPNYYRSRADDGRLLHVNRATEQLSKLMQRLERIRRRWRDWRHEQG